MNLIGLLVLSLFANSPNNSYCGTSPGSFYPVPQIVCPGPGPHLIDVNCADACADLWQTEMMLAYDNACILQDTAYDLWNAWEETIKAGYAACMQVAVTPQDGVNCYVEMQNLQSINKRVFNEQSQGIANVLAADVQAAMDSYNNCVSNCCYSILPPDEQ